MISHVRSRPESPQTKLLALRGTIVGSSGQVAFVAALLAIHRTAPVWFAVAVAAAAFAAAAALLLRSRAVIEATASSPLDDPVTGGFDPARERRVHRILLAAYGVPLLFEVVVVAILIARHAGGHG